MFLLGIVCVLASFGGYLMSGGGEELLRRALLNVTSGKAKYESLEVNWKEGRIEVVNIENEDFVWPQKNPIARLKNLKAPKLIVQFAGWPAVVQNITVQGMSGAEIDVDEGFLQQGDLSGHKPPKNLPRIVFEDCDVKVVLGGAPPLELSGCNGELQRDSEADGGRLRGRFHLRELNGKPFDLNVESLENDRWVVTGNTIQLDTRTALSAKRNPFEAKFDPVGLLMKALFSGEMGARGTLTSLHISVLPAAGDLGFSCEGEVGYSNLSLKLPAAADTSGKALPFFLGMLLGVDEKQGAELWPRLMQVDQITTGEKGRVAFHMSDGRLDFSCDEGAGSAFTGVRDGIPFPPLESLKGSVETDALGLPKRIVLRGFLGEQVGFEGRVARGGDGSRTTELILLPRSGNAAQLAFGRPLWRFESRVKDYVSVPNRPPDLALAEFEAEASVHGFPFADWLPPGMTQVSGRATVKGSYGNRDGDPKVGSVLRLENVRWDDGAGMIFGGAAGRVPGADFHPFWEAFYAVFATEKAWMLRDAVVTGGADIFFDANLQWTRAAFNHWTLHAGVIADDGPLTVVAPPEVTLDCETKRDPATEAKTVDVSAAGSDWRVALKGNWVHDKGKPASGDFVYSESNVPLKLHPKREKLAQTGAVHDDRIQRALSVKVRADGVKIESK